MKVTKVVKAILPKSLFKALKSKKRTYSMRNHLDREYAYDKSRYYTHSSFMERDTAQKLIGYIIREYHVVEKGLTMPETKLGFGKDLIIRLSDACIRYVQFYGTDEPQLKQAIQSILEYKQYHDAANFNLDREVEDKIDTIISLDIIEKASEQKVLSSGLYFDKVDAPFAEFAHSRASIRNYSTEDIDMESINNALDLATTTPSACNRQCWRSYVYTDKSQITDILAAQGGNRGFGHLANKLIVVTAEVGVFLNKTERNQAFIDGGMYAMNLLYALHYNKVAGCILNCSFSSDKDAQMRKLCKIKDSEVFIAMISCGNVPDDFKAALSKRYNYNFINTVIK
jgi:Nitroreductase